MLERIFGKKKEPATAPDVTLGVPKDIRDGIDGHAGHNAKTIFADYLKTVGRVQLLAIGDDPWYKDHKEHDWLVEAYDAEEWERDWPLGEYQYKHGLPGLIMSTIEGKGKGHIDLSKLVKQVAGIQKKLDKVLAIIDSNEVTMSVKTALRL